MNGYQFKLVKLKGEFVWHDHKDTDEIFIIYSGSLKIEFRDRVEELNKCEMIVVPKGVEHKPVAEEECFVIVVEPKGVVNTGDTGGEMTAPNDVWI